MRLRSPQHVIVARLIRSVAAASTLLLACVIAQAAPLSPWRSLPPQRIPTRQMDGRSWTEGLSATSAGRFTGSNYGGLLTETVYDYWFYTSVPRQWFDWVVPGADDEPIAETVRSDWTHMVWTREYAGGRRFRYILSSLAPGFLIQTNAPRMTLQGREGPKDTMIWETSLIRVMTMRSRPPLAFIVPRADGDVKLVKVLRPEQPMDLGTPAQPWIVILYPRREMEKNNLYFWDDTAAAVMLTFDQPDVTLRWWSGGLKLSAPGGIGTIGVSTAFDGLLKDAAGKDWSLADVAARARLLTRLLRTYPVTCREWYSRDGGWMRIFDEFTYYRWGDPRWRADDYAPVPPLYSWGAQAVGWPAFPGVKSTSILTRFGPYEFSPGRTLQYRLPIWGNEYASWPRTSGDPELRDATNAQGQAFVRQYLGRRLRAGAWGPINEPGISARLGSYNLLDDDVKQGYISVGRELVTSAWSWRNWFRRREPHTGLEYYGGGCGSANVKEPGAVDENSALGSMLYATYVWAKFSADWPLIRELMPRMWDAWRQFEIFNDWAAPQTSCRGDVKYSAIDMDTVALLGIFGMQRMSEIVGTPAQADRAAYLQAKVAHVTLLRFTMPEYIDPKHKEPRIFVTGFEVDGPERKLAVDEAVIKDHLAMMFTWCGQQPEMYHYYLAATGPEFWVRWQRDFYARPEFNWYEPRVNSGRLYSHVGIRAWLDWEGYWPWQDELARDFANARQRAGIAEDIAALYSARHTPAYLVEWEPAKLLGAEYEETSKILHARIDATKPGVVMIRVRTMPTGVTVNGAPAQTQVVAETLPIPRPELGSLIRVSTPAGNTDIVAQW